LKQLKAAENIAAGSLRSELTYLLIERIAARDARDDVRIIALWDSKSSLTFIYRIYINRRVYRLVQCTWFTSIVFNVLSVGGGGEAEWVPFKVTFTRNGPINNCHSAAAAGRYTITPRHHRPTDELYRK